MKKPRTVRNFWIKARVDSTSGSRDVSFGPGHGLYDGFELEVYMRKEGDVIVPVKLEGRNTGQNLILKVQLGQDTHILETER